MQRTSPPVSIAARHGSRLGAYLVVLVLPIAGCVFGGRAGLQAGKDGRAVYLGDCAPCHGTSGRGDGPVAQALKKAPADLTGLAERSSGTFPRQYVREVITGDRHIPAHGVREMPIWNDQFLPTASGATVGAAIYAGRHLESILGYLESIQRSPGNGK